MKFETVKDIGAVQKNASDELRVSIKRTDKGLAYLDVRTFSEWDKSDGKQPTRKGIALSRPEQISELIGLLERARDALS